MHVLKYHFEIIPLQRCGCVLCMYMCIYICWQAIDASTAPTDRVYLYFCVFKMPSATENTTDCEIHAVIRFLNAKGVKTVEIHHQIWEVYEQNIE